jgi:alpha-amylase
VSKTIDSNGASVTAAFNNGSGVWDNNGGKDYSFTGNTAAVNNGAVTTVNPCG